MRMQRAVSAIAVIGSAASFLVVGAGPASAHEEREVGSYVFVVGFGDEPAFSGEQNSVALFLNDAHTGEPVVDLGPTLKVDVSFGDATLDTMTMEPDFEVGEFGSPGDYRAFFFPTRPGTYEFHFTGTIKGQQIDETFTSGPKTFGPMEDPQPLEFPVQDPTTGQLNEKIDRVLPRLQSDLQEQAASLKDDTDQAQLLAIIGVAVGGLGLLFGVWALIRSRRS